MTKWQNAEKKPAGEKPTKRKRRPEMRPARAVPCIRSKAAGESAGENAGDKDPGKEKGIVVSTGRGSSSLGDPGEPKFVKGAKMTEIEKTVTPAAKSTPAKIWQLIEYNRMIVIGPVIGLMLWIYALSCTPLTRSPLDPATFVNERQLKVDLKTWQAQQEIMIIKFESAGEDLKKQRENNEKFQAMILDLANGGIPDMPGLVKLFLGGGALGALGDNIRKRGLIAGLKRNKTNET